MTDVVASFELQEEHQISANFTLTDGTIYHNQLLHRDYLNQHPISAITDLQDSLDTLQTNIDNEASARENADDTLDTKIDNLEIAIGGDIQAEVTAREQADTRLEGLISDEETRAKAAEEALSDDISAENNRAINAEETLQDNIDAEETRAKNAEQGLSDDISSEAGTRVSEITRVEGLITAEETARISADNTLQGNINAEKTARENADSTLQGNIDAEELARQNADSALQSNIDAEALARGNADTALNTKIDNHIADKANPHQVTKAQVGLGNVDNTADIDKPISTAVSAAFDAVEDEITEINSKIPNAATSSNQLADKSYVNSSISTNTANFIGTFDSMADLEAYSGEVTNNDYAFVVGTDQQGNTVYDRYKYTTATTPASWVFEYELNNSSFTANQWAAINSGANTTNIGQIATNANDITTINTTISGYGDIVTHNVSEFATSAQGDKADTAVQPADLASVATSGSYTDLTDKPTIGNATLTIQQNSVSVGTFTANSTTNATVDITVPTDTSDLTNGAGYITGINSSDVSEALGYTPYDSANPSGYITSSALTPYVLSSSLASVATSGSYDDLTNKPTIGNGTLTIQANGVNLASFNANQTTDTAANIAIPDPLPSQAGQAGKYLTTDGTNASWGDVSSSSRNIGEIIQSTIPLTDAGLHLLDGSLISGDGVYGEFVTYMAGLVQTNPELFTTESDWQDSVATYGVCGKFVYDAIINTVRLKKMPTPERYLIKSSVTGTQWVRLYSDGWCEQGGAILTGSGAATVVLLKSFVNTAYSIQATAISKDSTNPQYYAKSVIDRQTDSFTINQYNNYFTPFFWQASGYADVSEYITNPEYTYIVVANSTKTEIEVDIDKVMTDLNALDTAKAEVDLSNVTAAGKISTIEWVCPDWDSAVDISSQLPYTAPKKGWIFGSLNGSNSAIKVNSVEVGRALGTSSWASYAEVSLLLDAGDVVSISSGSFPHGLQFVACKGV